MQVVTNSLLTNYNAAGKGKVLVLLHGWGDSSRTFASLQAQLAKKFRVISLDLPGFGNTQAPMTTWDLDDYSDFINDFLAKIGVKQVYAYIGHSNGGAIAIRGLANGKLESERLVLLAASGIRKGGWFRKTTFKTLAKAGKVVTWPLPERYKHQAREKLYKAAGSDMLIAENLSQTFKRTVAHDVQKDAAKLSIPTLLIYGQGDTQTPALFGMRYHNLIPGSQLLILEQAEHFVHQDQPEAVEAAINKFLQDELV